MNYTEIRDAIMAVERRVRENDKFTSQDAFALTQLGVPPSRIFAAVDYCKLQEQLTKHMILLMMED